MKYLCIIPARYNSTRLPGKPLADIGGKTMIQRVYERACSVFEDVLVATDDLRILKEVENFSGNAVMTADFHPSGTDRCLEALNIFEENSGKQFDIVINIQGDEPFIHKEQLVLLKNCFTEINVEIATLIKEISSESDYRNPNKPKVIINSDNFACYFSRAAIPYIREGNFEEVAKSIKFYKHIGVYGYKVEVLRKITKLEQSSLEKTEKLEQNRWLENGFRIKTAVTNFESLSVDTQEDLVEIKNFMENNMDLM